VSAVTSVGMTVLQSCICHTEETVTAVAGFSRAPYRDRAVPFTLRTPEPVPEDDIAVAVVVLVGRRRVPELGVVRGQGELVLV